MTQSPTRRECLARLRADSRQIEPGQKVTVAPFQPEDAAGVARLYYLIYGENFPLDYVYDPVRIAEANAGPDFYQFVARTASGDVIGLMALFRVAPNPKIMEFGGLMILPEYRGGTLAFRLTKAILEKLPQELGLNAGFGQSVCDHVITQKLGTHFSYRPLALELEAMPPRPDGSTDGVGGRISLLNELQIYRDAPHTVYLPARYAAFLMSQYEAHGLERTFGPSQPGHGGTQFFTTTMDGASLAKLLIQEPGADLENIITRFAADFPDRHVRQLHLPLAHPGLDRAVETARRHGYFFGGLLPLWTGTDVLMLQKLAAPPDFTLPRLLTEEAKALMNYIRSDWENLRA